MQHHQPARAGYAAFDRFPGPKGSAVHIGRAAGALFDQHGPGVLAALGGADLPRFQQEPQAEIHRFDTSVPNLLDRMDAFACFVDDVLAAHRDTLEMVQVRDPWSAAPALADPERRHRVVYEANGFPSIELPNAWPYAPADTLARIAAVEDACLRAADAVVAPSQGIADLAVRRGADPARVSVVRNGADVPDELPPRPAEAPERYLVYVGALQRWQGIGTLLQAMTRLADLPVRLVVCSSWSARRARGWVRQAERLGVPVDWHHELPHDEVAAWLAHAELSVAPLAEVPRNLEQGCCPLKVLESMAVATPVVASDLACVREIMGPAEGRLVAADRPGVLARAIRVLLDEPSLRTELGEAARERITTGLTWQHSDAALSAVWADVLSQR